MQSVSVFSKKSCFVTDGDNRTEHSEDCPAIQRLGRKMMRLGRTYEASFLTELIFDCRAVKTNNERIFKHIVRHKNELLTIPEIDE